MSAQTLDINLSLLVPEILISLLAMALLLLTAWRSDAGGQKLVRMISAIGIIVVAVITLGSFGTMTETTFDGLFINDAFSVYMKLLLFISTLFPLVMSWDYLVKNGIDKGEYQVLSLFALLGGMIMASSGDFMTLYLGLELMSLSIYVLAAFRRDDVRSNEAGLKYFILGSLASGLLLYGITLVYGNVGSTSFSEIHAHLASGAHLGESLSVGIILILSGFAFKIAAAPFHMWSPDVYQGAPTSVTAFMGAMPKIAAFAGIYRIFLDAFIPLFHEWGMVLKLLALLSLAVGAFAAIAQTNIKRMLAYSSIGHVGYALIGLAAGNQAGFEAVITYLSIYIFMNIGVFCFVLMLNQDGIGEEIEDYKGLSSQRPILAFVLALFMFSMAGIPPLAGFIGKLVIFKAAVEADLIGLAAVGILFSAVGAFYYLRIVKFMYFDTTESQFGMTVSPISKAVIAITSAVVIVFGIFPGALLEWVAISVKPFIS
ncbi:MAG: NADH-quinone oxidoreductase subunit NuoN [Magnetococcales bacterium]|nr:NADH-quinone oxidoreductase subunit NuoN [Magnetococcales bacterium]